MPKLARVLSSIVRPLRWPMTVTGWPERLARPHQSARSSLKPRSPCSSIDHDENYTYHVLVVEDNKTNQFIAEAMLEQAGMIVEIADNGQLGYDFFAAHQHEIDIILMDLHMPVMNGYDSARKIREIDQEI